MPRKKNPNQERAFEIYREHDGNISNREISKILGEDEKVIAVWKSRNKWNVVQQSNKSCTTNKRGAQPGNHNSAGGPPKNKKAEKYGFFSKYLPEEPREIFSAIEQSNPLDLIWHQIQIAYAAIIRAQRIAYVKDQADKTIEKVEEKKGKLLGERWEVQQAWDKQNEFMKAQARAQAELRALIKQYDEMLHRNWELATEEQKSRIRKLEAEAERIRNSNNSETEDDGVEIVNDCPT